jgi:hypothetical protein
MEETGMKSVTTRHGTVAAMLGAASLLAAALPTAAYAEMVTLKWVPISETPATSGPSTAHGSITLNISPWTLTAISGNGLGPNYYTSGSAVAATITAISYTAGDGQTVDSLLDLSTTALRATVWATSAMDEPATGAQAPSPPPAGYYLISAFSFSGKTDQGAPVMFANAAGTAGANYGNGIDASGIGNGDVTDNAMGAFRGTETGGYWEVSPVPLPPALPQLLSGLALFGWFARRAVSRKAGR